MIRVPAYINRKLIQIYKHQQAVKDLVADIVDRYPQLIDYEDEQMETWSMAIDQQGDFFCPVSSLRFLETMLNGAEKAEDTE